MLFLRNEPIIPSMRKHDDIPAISEEDLWEQVIRLQGEYFLTAKGLKYSYRIKGGEIFVDRKDKSITKASVMIALRKAIELSGVVSGPKQLGVFGASYLFPVFLRLGIIRRNITQPELTLPLPPDIINPPLIVKEMPVMPRPKGSKNKKTVIVENIDEKIAAAEKEIAELTDTLKTKKAELKDLVKAKAESAKIAAAKKAEEDKATILAAVEKSGKSVEEILEMLKGE